MNNKDFTGVLQVALWRNNGMNELEIRQHLAKLVNNNVIVAGIKLHEYLNTIRISNDKSTS